VPNLVQVAVGPDGKVNLYVAGSAADLIVDVEGWYGDSTDSYGQDGLYYPFPPLRAYDSRFISTANGDLHEPLGPGQTRLVNVWGASVGSFDEGVALNVTAVNPTRSGFLTVYPTGSPRPNTSNVNFVAGQTVANRVVMPIGTDGHVSIYNSSGSVDIVVDVNGSFSGFGAPGGWPFIAGSPARMFDSRTQAPGKMPPSSIYDFSLNSTSISGLALNVTATNPTSYGFLTLYPDNGSHGVTEDIPQTSDLNFGPGQTVANACLVRVLDANAFNVYNPFGHTDLIIDIDGLYGTFTSGSAATPANPKSAKEPERPALLPIRPTSPRLQVPAG
jgi:hypothetical protein